MGDLQNCFVTVFKLTGASPRNSSVNSEYCTRNMMHHGPLMCSVSPIPASKYLFQAAEQSQQRGERRRGQEAIPHFQKAVEQFKRGIELGLDTDKNGHAHVLCADALQGWAQSVLAAEASLPDEQQSLAVEAAAKSEASRLYQQAIQVQLPGAPEPATAFKQPVLTVHK